MTQPHFLEWLEPYMDQRMVPPDKADAKKFDPSEPRDAGGRWASGGSYDAASDWRGVGDGPHVIVSVVPHRTQIHRVRLDDGRLARCMSHGHCGDCGAPVVMDKRGIFVHSFMTDRGTMNYNPRRDVRVQPNVFRDAEPDVTKYDPEQPRDEAGRWTSGGGGSPVDTVAMHTQMGAWTPERAALHRSILDKAMAGVPINPSGPVLYMTGGGYGSGKSTLLNAFPEVAGFPKGADAVRMDPDAIKHALPEFSQRALAGDRAAATFVHEESSTVAKDGVKEALASGRDVIYDTSGDTDPEKLAAKVAAYREAGATAVNANYAFPGSIEEAQARADARAAASDGALRRYVPPAMLEANHAEVARCWLASANSGTFDNLTLWSTAGEFGSPPTLIASAQGGVTTVTDQTQFDAFKALGVEP